MAPKTPDSPSGPTLGVLADSFRRSLLAENKSPKTVTTYLDAVTGFEAYLRAKRLPTAVDRIPKTFCLDFIADQLARFKPATASVRYRALQTFFRWAVAEGELEASPMATMRPPHVPETPPNVYTDDEIHRLLAACEGRAFEDRRDTAIVRLFLDTGMRLAEAAGLQSPTSISSRTSRSCWARAAGNEPVRSAAERPRRSIDTCAPGQATATRIGPSSGSAWPDR